MSAPASAVGRAAFCAWEDDENIIHRRVSDVMTRGPITVRENRLAAEAFEVLRARRIDELPVVDAQGRPVGLLDVQDLLKAGFV